MRVISGKRKGKKLYGPKSYNIRPTEDRIKESMFNIISPIVENAIVLDLFSGTGSIGIEFISRGAETVFFVDNSIDSIQLINRNLELTGFLTDAKVFRMDVLKALDLLSNRGLKFDYIFMDPPYDNVELYNRTLEKISSLNILKINGILIAEHNVNLLLRESFGNLKIADIRKYGNKSMTYFRNYEVTANESNIPGKF
ncbi:16S rRNA (guanine(966)-N(2))-methyltransferase RsmD [Soehngenia saccharolytica]|jgi:16S rRNA (guanine(966)-N(2))-methyltransferase RsmD|nr:16S rRNA (guanine(966)-N(2))-methyltransferase RsmD [Soehngenia saccharolytica]